MSPVQTENETAPKRFCVRCGRETSEEVCLACEVDTVMSLGDSDASSKLIGQVFDGKYEIESVLGQGGMGTVFRARQISIDRPVAIKVMHPVFAADEDSVKRFQREARLTSKLAHPNIISVFDFGVTDQGLMYIVMELLKGRELEEEISSAGFLPIKWALELCAQAARALRTAHALDIVHRDLKPSNMFLVQDQTGGEWLKIMDFGLAKSLDESAASKVTKAGVVVGTPAYMSPEQAKGGKIEANSDIYSLGIILYEMLTGSVPFESDSTIGVLMLHVSRAPGPLSARKPELAPFKDLQSLVDKMLMKEPSDRPSAAETLEHLETLLKKELVAEKVHEPRLSTEINVDNVGVEEVTAFVSAMPDVDPGPDPREKMEPSERDDAGRAGAIAPPQVGPPRSVRSGELRSSRRSTKSRQRAGPAPARPQLARRGPLDVSSASKGARPAVPRAASAPKPRVRAPVKPRRPLKSLSPSSASFASSAEEVTAFVAAVQPPTSTPIPTSASAAGQKGRHPGALVAAVLLLIAALVGVGWALLSGGGAAEQVSKVETAQQGQEVAAAGESLPAAAAESGSPASEDSPSEGLLAAADASAASGSAVSAGASAGSGSAVSAGASAGPDASASSDASAASSDVEGSEGAASGGPAPALSSKVRVVSNPSGAKVAVEGITLGETPLLVGRPAQGHAVSLTLILPHYRERVVSLKHDQAGDLEIELQKVPAKRRRHLSSKKRSRRPKKKKKTGGALDMMMN